MMKPQTERLALSTREAAATIGLSQRTLQKYIHEDSITIEERYRRGDWSAPKTQASAATIGVERNVLARIHRLKQLTVDVKAGNAVRCHKVVKTDGPDDLVFQSVRDGKPMRDNNILKRFLPGGVASMFWLCGRAIGWHARPNTFCRCLMNSTHAR